MALRVSISRSRMIILGDQRFPITAVAKASGPAVWSFVLVFLSTFSFLIAYLARAVYIN
jgi:hypothetical protein